MTLKDELASITSDEARWALLSMFEQQNTALKSDGVEQDVEIRTQSAETAYPGLVTLSNLVMESMMRVDSVRSLSAEDAAKMYGQFMILALSHLADIRDRHPEQ